MTGAAFLRLHVHSADRVQGEALLSVGEAHNNLCPVPARAGPNEPRACGAYSGERGQ